MAGGKVSPVVITCAAMVMAMERVELLKTLDATLKHIFIAGQLYDDALDWRFDLADGHVTYFLTQFLIEDGIGSFKLPDEAEVLTSMDSNWQDVEHLKQALAGYRQALGVVDGLACHAWKALVEEYISMTETHRLELIHFHVMKKLSQISESDLRAAFGEPEMP